ncbi:MAG: restriction endonuclease [Proteobacteria bacterium]|nr:restriction endonuclease [Pseudomonadota bacterium]
MENFESVGCRDLHSLKEKGLTVKESELGSLYEELTKNIFKKLGFNVDEKLRQELNTDRAKMDILLNLGGKDVIIVECKSVKDKDYNKYTAVSRQLKSYESLCKKKGCHVSQVVIVSNEFTEDFISECEYDYELSISLITSSGLVKILEGLKESPLTELPVRLLLKDGVLNADRIVKVLNR